MKYALLSLFISCFCCLGVDNLGIKGLRYSAKNLEAKLKTNLITFTDITISFNEIQIKADKLILNSKNKDFIARGNVSIKDNQFISHSQSARGNLLLKNFIIKAPKIKNNFWNLKTKNTGTYKKNYILYKVTLTTCNKESGQEDYHIVADKIIYSQKKGFQAYNTTLYLNQIPIFYLPYFPGKIDISDGRWRIRPAYSSRWGATLLNSLKYNVSENGYANFILDLHQKRGFAIGNNIIYNVENSSTRFLIYGLINQKISHNFSGKFRQKKKQARIHLNHSSKIAKNTYAKAKINYANDILFLNDSYHNQTFDFAYTYANVNIEYIGDNFDLSLQVQPRVNKFSSAIERLPEITFNLHPQNLFYSLYYSQKTTASYLRLNWLENETTSINNINDYKSGRFVSQHLLHYYARISSFNIIPRTGIKIINYSATSNKAVNFNNFSQLIFFDDPYINRDNFLDNYDFNGEGKTRIIAEFGLELNTTIEGRSKWQSKKFQLNQLITPYLNWVYIPRTNLSLNKILFFDEVDRINYNHFIRLGLDQQIESSSKGENYHSLIFNHYVDYFLENEFNTDFFGDYGFMAQLNFNENWNTNTEILTDLDKKHINALLFKINYSNGKKFNANILYIKREDYQSLDRHSFGSSFLENAVDSSYYARRYGEIESVSLKIKTKLNKRWELATSTDYDLYKNQLAKTSISANYSNDCLNYKLYYADTGENKQIVFEITLKHFAQFKDFFR